MQVGLRLPAGPSVYARPGVIDLSIPLGGRSFAIAVEFDQRGRRHTGGATVMLTGDNRQPFLARAWTMD